MLAFSKHHDLRELDDRLRDAPEVTAELMSEILAEARRRLPSAGRTGKPRGSNADRSAPGPMPRWR
jgi:hypothetical protein